MMTSASEEIVALRWIIMHYACMGSNTIGTSVVFNDLDPIEAVKELRKNDIKSFGRSITDEALLHGWKHRADVWFKNYLHTHKTFIETALQLATKCWCELNNISVTNEAIYTPEWLLKFAEEAI